MVEDDIRLVFDKYNSSFITYGIDPGIYTFKDPSEALFDILQHEYPESSIEIAIEFDEISTKTKLVANSGIIALKFDEQSFFSTVVGFTSGWDYKHYIKYTSQKFVNLGNTIKIHLKSVVIDGSVIDGLRQPVLYSFVSDNYPDTKCFANQKQYVIKK